MRNAGGVGGEEDFDRRASHGKEVRPGEHLAGSGADRSDDSEANGVEYGRELGQPSPETR